MVSSQAQVPWLKETQTGYVPPQIYFQLSWNPESSSSRYTGALISKMGKPFL